MIELFSGLLEILLEILPEILPDCIQSSTPGGVTNLMNDWACGPLLWDWALTIGGAVAGLISAWVLPYRLLQAATAFPLSLVFAPLATGVATWSIGVILRRMTVSPNRLATFSCGALFAFALAVTRWWLVVVLR